MLEPEYLEKFSDQLLALVDALSTAIIADMSKRLVKTGEITETSRRQAEILQGAGLLYKDVLKRAMKIEQRQEKVGTGNVPTFFRMQIPGKHLQSGHFLIY